MRSRIVLPLALFSVVLVLSLILPSSAEGASFGVSPPYVQNYHLLRGSHYETTVNLLSDTDEGWIEVHNDASYAQGWLTFEPGENFTWPEGSSRMHLKIIVDIPEDAELGAYTGEYIHVEKHTPPPEGGGVGIVVGGAIIVTLTVTDEEFLDFRVRDVHVMSTEEGWPIKVDLSIENEGNIGAAPTKVRLDVYSYQGQPPVQSAEDTTLESIEPFTTKDIIAEFATTYLTIGEYFCGLEVYNGNETVWEGAYWILYVTNNPPNTPSSPSPPDTAAELPVTLSWTGGDSDPGDAVTYDVYFGTDEAPPPVSHNQTATNYELGVLEHNVNYHWKVAATDSHGVTIEGPLWSFATYQSPVIGLGFNGVEAGPYAEFYYCEGVNLTVTLFEEYAGQAPYTITWTVAENPSMGGTATVGKGDTLFSGVLDDGVYTIQVTSIVDVYDCAAEEGFLETCWAIVAVRAADIMDYYRHLHEPYYELTTLDLLAAIDDWLADVVPPDFDQCVTTLQLLGLIDEWLVVGA
jgi:hypothetical protein